MKKTKLDTRTRKPLTLAPLTIRALSAENVTGGMLPYTSRCTFETCNCTLDC